MREVACIRGVMVGYDSTRFFLGRNSYISSRYHSCIDRFFLVPYGYIDAVLLLLGFMLVADVRLMNAVR